MERNRFSIGGNISILKSEPYIQREYNIRYLSISLTCGSYDTPPWKTAENSPRGLHTTLSSSSTCLASSRVGHRTIIPGSRPLLILSVPSLASSALPVPLAISTSRIIAGMPKARVLPVPVRDLPMTSRPASTGLIAFACTGVKWVMPLWDSTSMTSCGTPHVVQWGLDVDRNLGFVKSSSSWIGMGK